MTSKRLIVFLGLFLSSIGAFGQFSTTYPRQQGIVNDYAHRLSDDQVEELSSLIRQYEQQTSIEIAVVTVNDLDGQSAREFAIALGNTWAVGKAGRDNGIVLLWAPNQRAYSLRIAGGLSPDLSDSDARLITQQHLLPNFKRGQYYAGLKETVQATMTFLGDKTWEERLQARAQAAQSQQDARASNRQEDAQRYSLDTAFGGGVILLAAIGVLIAIALHKRRIHQAKLAELTQAGPIIEDQLRTAEGNRAQVQQLLDDFAKESPEQNLTALRTDFAGQADRIVQIRLDATLLNITNLQSYHEMLQLKTRAETEAGLLEKMQQQVASIKSAKSRSQALLENLSKESFEISDVRDGFRRAQIDRLLSSSRQDYEQARRDSSLSLVDWLVIDSLLNRSRGGIQQAYQYSIQEPTVPSFGSFDSSSNSNSSVSIFGSSSSASDSSFSSSFSGGGGDFSGGSGSDGTY